MNLIGVQDFCLLFSLEKMNKWIETFQSIKERLSWYIILCGQSHLLLKDSINNSNKLLLFTFFFNMHVKLLIVLNDFVKEHRTQGNSGKIKEGACWKTGIACQGPVSSWVFCRVLKYMLH